MNSVVGQLGCDRDILALQPAPSNSCMRAHGERLVGPVHGSYLACYALSSGSQFMAYAKVYWRPPTSAWELRQAIDKFSAGPFGTSELALEAVIEKASFAIATRQTRPNRIYHYLVRMR